MVEYCGLKIEEAKITALLTRDELPEERLYEYRKNHIRVYLEYEESDDSSHVRKINKFIDQIDSWVVENCEGCWSYSQFVAGSNGYRLEIIFEKRADMKKFHDDYLVQYKLTQS